MLPAIVVLCAAAIATCCPVDFAQHIDPATDTEQFVSCMAFFEGRMLSAAYWPEQGLTRDGNFIYPNGTLGPGHMFSAPSKESLHLGVQARALAGNLDALTFVVAPQCALLPPLSSLEQCQSLAKQEGRATALDQLDRKLSSLERFNEQFPGYGGFLPWFSLVNGSIAPVNGWEQRIPALDNGEMIWALVAVSEALADDPEYAAITKRVAALLDRFAETAKLAFYEGGGRVRSVSRVLHPQASHLTSDDFTGEEGSGYLSDPYEGELFVQFLVLLAKNVSDDEKDSIWRQKRAMLQSVSFEGATLQRGWWFSSHEQWKYLLLPYSDVAANWAVFVNGEMARTIKSAHLAGLFASVNNVTKAVDAFSPAYYSANGISDFAFTASDCCGTTVTPYASFSVMLANLTAGLSWWANVAAAPHMHSQYGSLESTLTDGSQYCPLLTWDAKVTSFLAALGGTVDLNRAYLKRQNVYEAFASRVEREWSAVFPNPQRGGLSFVLPSVSIGGSSN